MAVVRLIRRRHLFRQSPTPMTSGGGAVETGQTGRPGRVTLSGDTADGWAGKHPAAKGPASSSPPTHQTRLKVNPKASGKPCLIYA